MDPTTDAVPPSTRGKALLSAGFLAWAQGASARAGALLEEALPILRAVGDRAGATRALQLLAMVAWQRGDFGAMGDLAATNVAAARDLGDDGAIGGALVVAGIAALHDGDATRADALLAAALTSYRVAGYARGISWAIVERAEVMVATGCPTEAAALIGESFEICRDADDAWGLFEAFVRLATLAGMRGRTEAAARLFGAGEGLRAVLGVIPFGGLAAYECAVAGVRGALGDRSFVAAWEAGRALPRGEAIAEALDLADRLARKAPALTPNPGSPRNYPAGLSAREVEVLRLVAQGLTNAQVAERLYLSPRTIDTHMQRIYGKLDVPNRGAAIRFAAEHSLL